MPQDLDEKMVGAAPPHKATAAGFASGIGTGAPPAAFPPAPSCAKPRSVAARGERAAAAGRTREETP
ncbi:hypothetical protein GCM10008026_28620 [Chelatococcus composti]|nr:hypothetical protein GCM10008026_28620 [Chelatococcus composti]